MCYSVMVEDEMSSYIRSTGAQIDIEQFTEIFGERVRDASVTVPRVIDRWFDHPKGANELPLRNLVMQHRAARLAEFEASIAKQRARIAAAEQKMATKPTKKAAEDLRIAPKQIAADERRIRTLQNWDQRTNRDDRVFPFEYTPIVMMVGGKPALRLARYHCRQNGKPASIDRQLPGLYNARRDSIDQWWRKEFGRTHAVMLVRSFFEWVTKDGRKVELQFTPDSHELMPVACVYSVWDDPKGGKPLLSVAVVTDEPPPEVSAAGHDRCPINLKPDNIHAWLTPEGRSDAELQAILSDRQTPYYINEVLAA